MQCQSCGGDISPEDKICGSCKSEIKESLTPPQPPEGKKPGGAKKLIAILLAVVLVSCAALGVYWYFPTLKQMLTSSTLGKASVKLPVQGDLIKTKDWGVVPANQVIVVLKDGLKQKDADQVASALGGKVVGFFVYINLYQIEIGTRTEADLIKALAAAKQNSGVELAFPNQQTFPDVKLAGVQVSSIDDPIYKGDNGKGYEVVGVQRAWNLIKASKANLSEVSVAVVDDGLYKGHGEFEGGIEVGGDTINAPAKKPDGSDHLAGSHGTGVTNIIAANPDNGGITGIASGALGKKLKVNMVNDFAPPYGNTWAPGPDPNDPTKVTYSNGFTQALGDLVALKSAIDKGARTINCSWGNTNAHPEVAAGYKRFFEKMAVEHPDVIFVCSAGNDNKVVDGTKRFPSGLNLPNMITVGNVMNDGTRAPSSNMSSPNFEVTLAAPGDQAVRGLNEKGQVLNSGGGTSNAAPQVTSAVAILRSLNPKLTAAEIKNILKETASKGTTVGKPGEPGYQTNLAPPGLGSGILAVDQAVLRVINDMRQAQGLKPLTMEDALAGTRIDLIAESDPKSVKDWKITATLPGVLAQDGTDATIELQGGGAIGGSTTKHLAANGTLDWSVTTEKDNATVLVTRTDSGSKWKVDLAPDLAGLWTGTALIERVLESIPSEYKPNADSKECEGIDIVAIMKEMKGKTLGIKMNVFERKDLKDPLKAEVTFIGFDGKPGNTFPLILGYDGTDVYFQINENGAIIRFDGQLKGNQISGEYNMKMPTEQGGLLEFIGGSWQITKQQ